MTALRLLVGLVVGITLGLASVLHHATSWGHLALAVAVPAVLVVVAPGPAARTGLALGWVATVLTAVLGTDEGDVLVLADARGWTLLVSALLFATVAIATIPVRKGLPT